VINNFSQISLDIFKGLLILFFYPFHKKSLGTRDFFFASHNSSLNFNPSPKPGPTISRLIPSLWSELFSLLELPPLTENDYPHFEMQLNLLIESFNFRHQDYLFCEIIRSWSAADFNLVFKHRKFIRDALVISMVSQRI